MSLQSQDIITLEQHQAELKYAPVENGKIAYIDKGEGPILLLMHGVPTSSYLYRKMIPLLVSNGYRVICPDAFGFGFSDKPKGYELYSSALQAKRILQLMESLEIDSWTQVCHDAGSIWTWEMMAAAPNKIQRLVILNSIVYEEGFKPPVRPGKFLSKFIAGFYQSPFWGKRLVPKTMKNGLYKHKLTKEEKRAYWLPFRENGKYAVRNFFQSMPSYPAIMENCHKMMKAQPIPTAVIWGAKDKILRAHDQVPYIMRDFQVDPLDVHILQNQNHFIQEEAPEMVVDLMVKFLKK